MSLWASYWKEIFNHESYETEEGFISWSINGTVCAIENVFVLPEFRKGNTGLKLFNYAREKGKEAGCLHLWTQVWLNHLDKERALRINLALGFKVIGVEKDRIIMMREIGE